MQAAQNAVILELSLRSYCEHRPRWQHWVHAFKGQKYARLPVHMHARDFYRGPSDARACCENVLHPSDAGARPGHGDVVGALSCDHNVHSPAAAAAAGPQRIEGEGGLLVLVAGIEEAVVQQQILR